MSNGEWMQRYVYIEMHEIFLGEFRIILTKWLERLVENIGRYRDAVSRNWTPELVRQLNSISNKTSCAVDFWLDIILGGYIREFTVDCTQTYSVAKRDFFKGPCEMFMKFLGTWIKTLLCDKCVMIMESKC
jgi:hypothetical protein